LKQAKEWWRWKGGSGWREKGKESKEADGVKATITANGRVDSKTVGCLHLEQACECGAGKRECNLGWLILLQ
jgi:hypothetical protein